MFAVRAAIAAASAWGNDRPTETPSSFRAVHEARFGRSPPQVANQGARTIVIYAVTAVALVLSAWLVLRKPSSDVDQGSSFVDRVAAAALWPAAAVTLVGLVFSVLSLPFVAVSLDQQDLEVLRALEARVPTWARGFGEHWVPKWYVMAGVALVALYLSARRVTANTNRERHRIHSWERVVERVRMASNAASAMSCAFFAASALTLFGDGLKDKLDDVRAQIHQAELRFEAGTDLLVSTLAEEIVKQSVATLWANTSHPNASLARDLGQGFATIRAGVHGYSQQPRDDIAAQRAVLAGLEMAMDANQVSASQSIDLAAEGTAMGTAQRSSVIEPVLDSRFRDRLSQTALRMLAPGTPSASATPTERREFAKEMLGRGVDELKKAAGEDPVVAFFAEVFAPMVSDALATVSSRAILEPMLKRLWNKAGTGDWHQEAKLEVKKVVAAIDTSRYWSNVGGGDAGRYKLWGESARVVADSLQAAHLTSPEPAAQDIWHSQPEGLLSRLLKPRQSEGLTAGEVERLASLLDRLGRPERATTLRQRLSLVASHDVGPEPLDGIVAESLVHACPQLVEHGVLASGRFASVDRPFVNPRPTWLSHIGSGTPPYVEPKRITLEPIRPPPRPRIIRIIP